MIDDRAPRRARLNPQSPAWPILPAPSAIRWPGHLRFTIFDLPFSFAARTDLARPIRNMSLRGPTRRSDRTAVLRTGPHRGRRGNLALPGHLRFAIFDFPFCLARRDALASPARRIQILLSFRPEVRPHPLVISTGASPSSSCHFDRSPAQRGAVEKSGHGLTLRHMLPGCPQV
jgi:hypothetical protein